MAFNVLKNNYIIYLKKYPIEFGVMNGLLLFLGLRLSLNDEKLGYCLIIFSMFIQIIYFLYVKNYQQVKCPPH